MLQTAEDLPADVVAIQIDAELDSRTCPYCEFLDGQVISIADPRWRDYVPPFHPACRCILFYVASDTRLTVEQEAVGGRKILRSIDARDLLAEPTLAFREPPEELTEENRYFDPGRKILDSILREGAHEMVSRVRWKLGLLDVENIDEGDLDVMPLGEIADLERQLDIFLYGDSEE